MTSVNQRFCDYAPRGYPGGRVGTCAHGILMKRDGAVDTRPESRPSAVVVCTSERSICCPDNPIGVIARYHCLPQTVDVSVMMMLSNEGRFQWPLAAILNGRSNVARWSCRSSGLNAGDARRNSSRVIESSTSHGPVVTGDSDERFVTAWEVKSISA